MVDSSYGFLFVMKIQKHHTTICFFCLQKNLHNSSLRNQKIINENIAMIKREKGKSFDLNYFVFLILVAKIHVQLLLSSTKKTINI